MPSPLALRRQIEAALADRIPSALTPAPRILRPVASTGIAALDELLEGGLPLGAITEMVGPECSGRTSSALSFVSQMTQAGKVCAWIDVSNALDPESAAAIGVDLSRLLWVRCGVPQSTNTKSISTDGFALPEKYLIPPPTKKGLHGGGFGPHPRNEVKGLSDAVSGFLRPEVTAPRCAEPQRRIKPEREVFEPNTPRRLLPQRKPVVSGKPWSRLEQALRVTDLLLQAGGFSAIVLDMGSIAPEYASRVPLATWFHYRAAAEKSQASILLLTQHACAKSSAGLVLRLQPGNPLQEEKTVFTGVEYRVEVARERFQTVSTNVIPLRKPPQRARDACWQSRTPWAGAR
ncbi:MAG: RecA domain protein [Edaphobacter sp.]|nr:RecA domain protein [Edaphobacter sp.]